MTCPCGGLCDWQGEKLLAGGRVLKSHWKCSKCGRVMLASRELPVGHKLTEPCAGRRKLERVKDPALVERDEKIAQLRQEYGWTYEMIARKFGVTRQRVAQILNGGGVK